MGDELVASGASKWAFGSRRGGEERRIYLYDTLRDTLMGEYTEIWAHMGIHGPLLSTDKQLF